VKPRTTTALYQTAARAWLTAAGLSLLLPPDRRLGLWLPLHLALAGAISTAISGAMQNFMLALTATPAPPAWLVRAQFTLVTTGAGAISVGMPTATPWLTGLGGSAFVAGTAILGWMLWRAWRKALNRRHAMPIAAYGAAVAFVVLGGTFGALLGSRVVAGEAYLQLRHAHMTTNVLGWASLTVVGTLVTLLPTALRVRMPPWRGRLVLGLLVGGLSAILLGWWAGATPILAAGGAAYAAGALGLVALVVAVLRVERTWGIPLAAMHMLGAAAWFVGGALGLGVALLDGVAGFDRFRLVFLTAFVGGWLVQVLLGAWSYLLPMGRPGHPDERRRSLAAFEALAPVQVVLLNGGLLLLAGRAAGWLGPAPADVGVVAALAGGGMALVKAWLFPILGRGPVDTDRARAVWGG
jgi:nitrite reductase (NO-forming)